MRKILITLALALSVTAHAVQVDTRFIKDRAITAGKLNSGAATNGQVATANGSGGVTYETPTGGSSANQFDCVVSATPIVGFSNYTTIGGCITNTAAGGEILIMKGTYPENVLQPKEFKITGQGKSTLVDGIWVVGSIGSTIRDFRINGSIAIDAGANGNLIEGITFAPSSTGFQDQGTGNYLQGIQE